MSSADSSHPFSPSLRPLDHGEALKLLPWLPIKDGLEDEERRRLLLHLDACGECRRELLYLSELRGALDVVGPDRVDGQPIRPMDTQASLDTVLARLDDRPEDSPNPSQVSRFPRSTGLPRASTLIRAAALALVVLGTFIVAEPWFHSPNEMSAGSTFTTLSDAPGPAAPEPAAPKPAAPGPAHADLARLAVGFSAETPVSRIIELLHGIDAELVSGPSRMGIFVIEPSAGAGGPALEFLRAQPEVTFAEPKG